MMKNIAIAFALVFVASTGIAFAGDAKTDTSTATTDNADGTKTTKKHSKKKAADGSTSETKTETTK